MVLTDSDRVPRVPSYLGFPPAWMPVSPTGLSPCAAGLSMPFGYRLPVPFAAPQPRRNFLRRFGLFPVRSPLLGESLLFSSPSGTEMFHFPEFASGSLWIQLPDPSPLRDGGFPIRTFPDHSLVGNSPGLFAASHVLLRLRLPRHPPCALRSLVTSSSPRPPQAKKTLPEKSPSLSCFFESALFFSCQRSPPACLPARLLKSRVSWWSRSGSNRRHPACKAGALPAELRPLRPFFPVPPTALGMSGRGGPGKI